MTHLIHYGFATHVVCLSRLANTLWYLGEPHAAVAARDAALELADEIGDPWTTGVTLVFAALLALEQGDVERLRGYAERLGGYDWPTIQYPREAYVGYLDVLDGRQGTARIRRALEASRGGEHAPGMYAMNTPIFLAACVLAGDRSGLEVPVPSGLFDGMVRRLQGTLAERTAHDPARP